VSETDKKTEALIKCKEALDVWINTYAPEFCDEEDVKWAREQLYDCGTLCYIGRVSQMVDEALKGG